MKKSDFCYIVAMLALVVMLVVFGLAFTAKPARAASVPEGHVGIVIKWSKAQDETLSPGFYFTNPFTTSVKLMDMRWQKYSTQTSAFSKDIQQVETEQEQQTLVEQAEAERARIRTEAAAEQKLISAKAEAEAVRIAADAEAYRLEMESKNITDGLIRKETIEKWDGKLPTITGADAVPLIDVEGVEAGV